MNRPNDRQGHKPQQGFSGKPKSDRRDQPETTLDTSKIVFKPVDPELFDSVARATAQTLAATKREVNKSTQIRRFYDEVLMWESKVSQNPDRFNEYLPFIRMLNAKAAYAQGRGHVDENFTCFMRHALQRVDDAQTLRTFKLFFEAMLGFFKLEKKD